MTTSIPGWDSRLPWLRAGTTWRDWGSRASNGHGGRRSGDPVAAVAETFLAAGWRSVVRSRQVHGAVTLVHTDLPPGETVVGDGDGHVTRTPGLLLTVTLADCVPVFVADPVRKAVALFHAGWRGTAAGVVERGLSVMARESGSVPSDLLVHLGPAICGRCYEVGPEVFEALGETPPPKATPIDLRARVRRQALAAGIQDEGLSVSRECTLCGNGRYFSHRGGDVGRHRGFIGIHPRSGVRGPGRSA